MSHLPQAYKILVTFPEGKRPLGWLWRRWKDTKMGLTETEWNEVVDRIQLTPDKVSSAGHLWRRQKIFGFRKIMGAISSFSRRVLLDRYCHVNMDGVSITDSIYWPLIHSRVVTIFYSSLAHALSIFQPVVSSSSFLVTATNNGYSSASGLKSSLNGGSLTTELFLSLSLMLRPSVGQYSWCQAPIWGLRWDFYYCQTAEGLLMWDALSDERKGLPFTIAAGHRQRSHSRVRVPWGYPRFNCPHYETFARTE
jgi:hypothetical protein